MRNSLVTFSLTVFSLAAAPVPAPATIGTSEPQSWRFAHPDAQILAGIDFVRLQETAEGRSLCRRFASALGNPLVMQAERLLLSTVFDDGGQRSDVLILSGKFSLADLRHIASAERARIFSFKGLEIAAPPGSTAADPHLAWSIAQNERTIVLIGTRPAIQAAAERNTGRPDPLAATNTLFARALQVGVQYPVWVLCDSIPVGFGPKSLDSFDDVEELDVAIRPGATADLQLWLSTGADEGADKVLNALQAAAGKESFVLSPWLQQMKGLTDGRTLKLGTSMPAANAETQIPVLLASFGLPVDLRLPPPPPEIRAKVTAAGIASISPVLHLRPLANLPPPPQRIVRILGLEDGSKEIPYPEKQ